MDRGVLLRAAVGGRPLPNYLVPKVLRAKHFIKQRLDQMRYSGIKVNVDAAVLAQELSKMHSHPEKPFEIAVNSASPGIAVCFDFEHRRLLVKTFTLNGHWE